jgi:hypothetical protein
MPETELKLYSGGSRRITETKEESLVQERGRKPPFYRLKGPFKK